MRKWEWAQFRVCLLANMLKQCTILAKKRELIRMIPLEVAFIGIMDYKRTDLKIF